MQDCKGSERVTDVAEEEDEEEEDKNFDTHNKQ